jgi:hypothetical protein
MTAIVPAWIATKKQLKAAISEGVEITLLDPTPWGDDQIVLNKARPGAELNPHRKIPLGRTSSETILQPGEAIFCTNHPKRSWFAEIVVMPDNSLKVS